VQEVGREKRSGPGRIWLDIHPWIILGAVAVLVPLLVFVTLDRIERHREQTRELLLAKGQALILSFEAAVRTGLGMQWTGFQVQKLLLETARQPDIDYIVVTDTLGTILADSDPSLVGERYGTDLDLVRIARSPALSWRKMPQPAGADSFEVYRGFFPSGLPGGAADKQQRIGMMTPTASASPAGLVIFVGMDMGPIEESRRDDLRHSIGTTIILLLVGFSGIMSLLLVQGYRTARSSLAQLTTFADNLVATIPVGLLVIDRNGLLTLCNQTAEAILKISARQITGQPAAAVLPAPFAETVTLLEGRQEVLVRPVTLREASGKSISLEIIASVLHTADGAFQGYVLLFRDMTEMENLKEEVAKSQRLAAIGSLAAGVAHEIRNPLSSIKGFATYFKERHRDHPADSKTAEIMITEVDRLNRVITQLLDLARPVTLALRPVSPAAALQHALALIADEARERHVVVTADLAAGAGEVMMDPDRIEQVLLNLFLNALEAMPAGGTLTVQTSQQGSMAAITVTDTGGGINREDLPHIFDPYFTTKPAGTGLGLAVAHRICLLYTSDAADE